MKSLGLILLVLGILGLIVAFNMDTTVSTESQSIGDIYIHSSRVYNIGLMEERRNYIILSCVGIVSGLLLIGLGSIQDTLKENAEKAKVPQGIPCPHCKNLLQGYPTICPHCQQDIIWIYGIPRTVEEANNIEKQRLREEQVRKHMEEYESQKRKEKIAAVAKSTRSFFNTSVFMFKKTYKFDNILKVLAGEGNNLIYHFLQIILYAIIPISLIIYFMLH